MDAQKSVSPLTPHRTNLPQTPKQPKKHKDDRLLHAVEEHITNNKACDLLAIILADPHLKQLNSSLQKEAQEQKKSKLLQSFPLRYNTLVQTEILYRQLQLQVKQQKKEQAQLIQKYSNQIATLRQDVQQLEGQIQKKQQQIESIGWKHAQQLEQAETQRRKDINSKNKQLLIKDSLHNELEKKYMKLKSQKDHTTEYVDQLKEECQVLRTQNDRIVVNLTQKELEIQQLQQTILKNKQQHQAEMQALMDQISQIENKYSTRFGQKNQEYSELEQTLNSANKALEKCESQLLKAEQEKIELQNQIERINQQKDRERSQAEEEINQLKNNISKMAQQTVSMQVEYKQKISRLQSQMHQQDIFAQQQSSKQQAELAHLQKIINQMLTNNHLAQTHTQSKVIQLQQTTLELQSTITQLTQQKQSLAQQLQSANTLNSQMEIQIKQAHAKAQKQQAKHKDIERMIGEFKKQMQNYDVIINQKEEKIQSYRKEILCLRRQTKQMAITTQQMLANSQKTEQYITQLVEQKQMLELSLKQTIIQLQQIELLNTVSNKQFTSIGMQAQIDDGQPIQTQIDQLQRQLEKAQLKYLNVIEELNQHKRQFNEQLSHKDTLIAQLSLENNTIRSALDGRMADNAHIESVIDLKIKQVKQFYEDKLEQEDSRYKKIIETLKAEMTELYNDIDLKKSIEEEMFEEIMKINSERRSKTSAQ